MTERLDPHEKPPAGIRNLYKQHQPRRQDGTRKGRSKKAGRDESGTGGEVIDLENDSVLRLSEAVGAGRGEVMIGQTTEDGKLRLVGVIDPDRMMQAHTAVSGDSKSGQARPTAVFESTVLPGLQLIPALLSPELQVGLLDRMMHEDVQADGNLTNLHAHYDVSYSGPSLFASERVDRGDGLQMGKWTAKDANVHRPIGVQQVLDKKLRWVTFGGQYDWTKKEYPNRERHSQAETAASQNQGESATGENKQRDDPAFPIPIGRFINTLFPDTTAEAAILNFYSPGDTLSLHRDVAEFCNRPLVSVSIGCSSIFVVGVSTVKQDGDGQDGDGHDGSEGQGECDAVAVMVRSGDVIVMSGPARFAWHGIPAVLPGTCPEFLQDWPATPKDASRDDDEVGVGQEPYDAWRGWMRTKRVNLNVRQMWDR